MWWSEIDSNALLHVREAEWLVFPHHSVSAVKWSTALSLRLFLSATLNIFAHSVPTDSLCLLNPLLEHTHTHKHATYISRQVRWEPPASSACLLNYCFIHMSAHIRSHQSLLEVGLNVLVVIWFIKLFSCVIHLLGCESFSSAKYTCVYSCNQFNKS